jgi:hypothetical protein
MPEQPAPNIEEIERKETEIKRLEALAHEKPHIRRHALRLAGLYLQCAVQEIIEREVNELNEVLSAAHEAVIEAIAQEVVTIGEALSAQAKEVQKRNRCSMFNMPLQPLFRVSH